MSIKKNNSKSSTNVLSLAFWVAIVAIIIAYLLFRERQQNYQRKQERIKDLEKYKEGLIEEKKKLQNLKETASDKLAEVEKNFVISYRIFRTLVIVIWILGISIFHHFYKKDLIDAALQFNSLIIFILVVINFLFYDRVLDFKELLGEVKERLKNILYKHSLKLTDDIYQYNEELDVIEFRLDAIERELKDLST